MTQLPDNVRAFLEESRFCVLATLNSDGSIQQTVMWYLLEGDRILMNTARGRVKAANLQANPKVSLCIEDGYRYVTIEGTAKLNDDQEIAHADIRRIGVRYVGEDRIADMYENQFRTQHRVTISVPIEHIIIKDV